MYLFPETTNKTHFFRMDKVLVMSGAWAKLSLSSKTIYPTLAIHADKNGLAFPSQETIGIMSGCTPKTVREGIDGLLGFPGFRIDNWVTKRGKRAKKYFIKSPPVKKGTAFRIYRAFFDGGNWSQLSSVGKAVYPAIKAFSFFDFEIYGALINDDDKDPGSRFSDMYKIFGEKDLGLFETREFDIAEPDVDVLADYAGISRRSVYSALDDLEKKHFIQRNDELSQTYWKLFLRPAMIYKHEWLNSYARYVDMKHKPCANITH